MRLTTRLYLLAFSLAVSLPAQIIGGGGGGGGVSNVASGCGIAGGPITNTGTLTMSLTVNNQTGTSYTIANGDCGKLISQNNAAASAYTLPQAGAGGNFAAGWNVFLQNRGAGTLTVTPTTSTVDGAATLVLAQGQGATIVSDGTNYYTLRGSGLSTVGNDTNVQGSISGATITLSWAGTLATSRGGLGASFGACTGGPTFSGGVASCTAATGTLGSVVYSTSPTITTPTISGHLTIEGVTTTGGTGTGNLVFSTSPTVSTSLLVSGSVSGTITIATQGAAGTYNFNLPTAAGSSGQPLLSGGGGATAMTFGTLTVSAGGTGLTSGTSGGVPCFTASNAIASSGALTANLPVIGGGAGVCPSVGTVTGSTTKFVTYTGASTANAINKNDASGNETATGWTVDASNNLSGPGTITGGSGSGTTGYICFNGKTSGGQCLTVADIAGSQVAYLWPSAVASGSFLKDNGVVACPTFPAGGPTVCESLAWSSAVSGVNSGTAGQLTWYAATGATVSGNANATISNGQLTLGQAGSVLGSICLSGSSSGTTCVQPAASASGTLTLPAATDTLVGRATTDTLTNKTLTNPSLGADSVPSAVTQGYTNDGTTGTGANLIAKISANDTVIKVGTTDTEAVGICVSGCSTTGSSQIAVGGSASCVFDNASTAGHYVQISTGTAGDCHDAGATLPTTGGTIIGRVASGGVAGTHTVAVHIQSQGGSGGTGIAWIAGHNNPNVGTGHTYMPPTGGYNTTALPVGSQVNVPFSKSSSATISNFCATVSTDLATGQNGTLTVMKNGTDQTLTVTFTGNGTEQTVCDTTHTFTINGTSDRVAMDWNTTAGAPATIFLGWSFQIQ